MKTCRIDGDDLVDTWDFNWPVMEVLIGGKSSIDLPKLQVKNESDADAFLLNYGYDVSKAKDRRMVHAYIVEAIIFIERKLMPKEWRKGRRPTDEIFYCDDIRKFLLWASDSSDSTRQAWSCSILRIVHTIAHLHGVQRKANIRVARGQIMGRFEKYLFRDRAGYLWLGDQNNAVQLERVEWKNDKRRDSIILKLLHKPGNVAETIYDLLGVRLITKRKSDVMMVVRFLRDFYMVTFPNTNPARSRNTIFGLDEFKKHIEKCRQDLHHKNITVEEFLETVENGFDVQKKTGRGANPHSSSSYRSIQLTCRQLIRYDNPALSWKKKITRFLEQNEIGDASELGNLETAEVSHDQTQEKEKTSCMGTLQGDRKAKLRHGREMLHDLVRLVSSWEGGQDSEEISVFYPFEVQILDHESSKVGESGEASHNRYKKSQVRAARKRILGQILWA